MLLKFSEKSFGLDISEKTIRLVQLKKLGNKIKLSSYGEISVPAGWIKDGLIVEKEKVAELIKKLIKKALGAKIHTRYANICLPEPKTFIKVIKVPYNKGKEVIKDIVDEAEKHIPFSLDKAYFDWQYIDAKDKTKVIIGVCPKEIVENYQEVMSLAEIKPISLEIEAAAIARSLFPLNKKIEGSVMIIDFGASRTGLLIYEQNYIPYSLSLSSSADELTEFIKNKLKISSEEAEKAKCEIGLDPQKAKGGLQKILKLPLEQLCKQVREAKYFYGEHFNADNLKKIYITGGGSYLKGLLDCVKEHSGMEAEFGNPLINISESDLKIPNEKVQSYNTAIGLALRQYE